MRLCAADAIGALGAPAGLDALTALAGDQHANLRKAAAEALAALGAPEGLDVLMVMTGDDDSDVRTAAARAIRSILQREGLEAAHGFLDLHERGVGIETLVQLDLLLYCPEPLRETFDPGQRMRFAF